MLGDEGSAERCGQSRHCWRSWAVPALREHTDQTDVFSKSWEYMPEACKIREQDWRTTGKFGNAHLGILILLRNCVLKGSSASG